MTEIVPLNPEEKVSTVAWQAISLAIFIPLACACARPRAAPGIGSPR